MFRPLHTEHAIESVILRLTGSGEMAENEWAVLEDGHEKYWKSALPSVTRGQVMEIALGPTPLVDGRPKPLAPTQFVEFMRTGKAAWWMEIAGSAITIGCARYGGWDVTSKKAYELFASLGKTVGNNHPLAQIRSVELTYQDLFLWEGAGDAYDPKLAIQEERIPMKARSATEWHVGEGWIESPEEARILERFQIGAELRSEGGQMHPVIQVVTTAIWGFGSTNARLKLDRAFQSIHAVGGVESDGRAVYDTLHGRTVALLGSLITADLASRIGLEQSGESP